MAMADKPDDDLIREMYARFGLAYYQSECLHRGLCTVLAWNGLPPRDLITRPRLEERLAQTFSLTLGDVAARLEAVLPAEFAGEIRTAVATRNFLAHHFWFDRAHLTFSVNDVRRLIAELDGYAQMFHRLDARVLEWLEPTRQRLGLTDELLQEGLDRILTGEADEPLPDKQAVREFEKKLIRRQRLIRVWEFSLEDGRKPLIFELADGSLWQLSDVGLGLTRFQVIGPGWTEHPAIKPHLPAEILPRPQHPAPWDYEFTLSNGAVLWVKPGRQKATFRWGVRAPKVNARRTSKEDEMRNRIEFRVEQQLPPKKDGANSMWATSAEVPRLIALRQAAVAAMAGRPPFRANVSLELEVHIVPGQRVGDLDNFVTGVCDGLMAAHTRIKQDPRWEVPECAKVHPSKCAAIEDDDAVISIMARKVVGGSAPCYRVSLEGE